MTLNKAKNLAIERLAERKGYPVDIVQFRDELTQLRRIGWIFFHPTTSSDGAKPVVVTHRGSVHFLETPHPADDELRELEQKLTCRQ